MELLAFAWRVQYGQFVHLDMLARPGSIPMTRGFFHENNGSFVDQNNGATGIVVVVFRLRGCRSQGQGSEQGGNDSGAHVGRLTRVVCEPLEEGWKVVELSAWFLLELELRVR